jgi:hypothetical protein
MDQKGTSRRGFLGLMIGGIAASAAVRTWPFRVFSFPSSVPQIILYELNGQSVFPLYAPNSALSSARVSYLCAKSRGKLALHPFEVPHLALWKGDFESYRREAELKFVQELRANGGY